MKKKSLITLPLGELIYELFEQAKEFSSEPTEQNLLVYSALQDLLKTQRVKTVSEAA